MHIVTKILVVFGAILSVLLSALTIAFSANADALRSAIAQEQSIRQAVEADAKSQFAAAGLEKATLVKEKEDQARQKETLDAQVKELQRQRTDLIGRVKKSEIEDQSIKNRIDNLTATAQSNSALIKALTEEVNSLRAAGLQSARRETELVDRLNDLESQRQVLEQTSRALQEQLSEARLALDQAKQGGPASASGAVGVFESTGPKIQARIVKLFKSPTGDDMAVISEGSNAGVKVNMKFNIVRDGFVASLIITTVDLQQSVGRIDRLGRPVEVRAEDMVLSRLD